MKEMEIVADLRVPCPNCSGGAVRVLVTPPGEDGITHMDVMHSAPDCSVALTTEDVFEAVTQLIGRLRKTPVDG